MSISPNGSTCGKPILHRPLRAASRPSSSSRHVRDRPGHDRRYAIDFKKAARELGYAPARDFATGLRATLDWYIANPGWWQALMGRRYSEWLEKNYQR